MTEDEKQWFEDLHQFMGQYVTIVVDGFYERWNMFPIDLYDAEKSEVIGGLLSRQATLSIELANSPLIWTGHVAPLILRCMTDVQITLAWILDNPEERVKQYILYGLGQEKLFIQYLKDRNPQDAMGIEDQIERMIQYKEQWLNSQRADYLTEVNVGSWSGKSTRDMARECGCENLYRYAYVPFSSVVHNMWPHISQYNMQQCTNPLHKFHKVPGLFDFKSDPDYVYRSAKYVSESYSIFDECYKLTIDTPLPQPWFEQEFQKLLDT